MKIVNIILRFWTGTLPHILVWLSLAILAYTALQVFSKETAYASLLQLFFSSIAIVIALSSVTFAYARTQEKNEQEYRKLVLAGEMFFYAALVLIMIFLISWLAYQADHLTGQSSWYGYVKWPLVIIFATPFAFLIFAANAVSKAIQILETNLWSKVKEEIR